MNQKPSVLLISVDALKPDYVFEQEKVGVSLPNITKYFIEKGATAREGMKSVFPTFTYPCHQSMITGTNPAVHGIVAFPTSVGAKGDFIAPEFWWDGSEIDSRFIDAVAKPQGMILEMEKEIGTYAGGLDLSDSGDAQRGKAAMWILKNKLAPVVKEKPFFLSAYFASFDESAHQNGVYSDEAKASLEKIDAMVGRLIEEAERITEGNLVVCVVSDHGSLNNTHNISPNILLKKAGLIETDETGKVIAWKAYSQRAGGTAEIRLADPSDKEAADTLKSILDGLLTDPESGILEVVNPEQAKVRGGFPDAAYILVSKKGYELRDDVDGEYCRTRLTQKAQHGYSEEFPEMRASFMITGAGIKKGNVENARLIDVAPTLAAIMGAQLPDAQGVNLLK